jgi:FAD-dependent urate hydroxylase
VSNFDVAIVGAGPYGLSLAAHLRARGVNYRQFGIPMGLWRTAMPKGMFLKSHGFASNLSDPTGSRTLEAFCKATGRGYAHMGRPVPLADFVSYGEWFQSECGLAIEEKTVGNITTQPGGFVLDVDGEQVTARRVVMAVGPGHFAHMPEVLKELPAELCTHSSKHVDPAAFVGRKVIIVGAGQSALELAGLMHESGTSVQILARRDVLWSGPPRTGPVPLIERIRTPESGLGGGWKLWFYDNLPGLFRRLPSEVRVLRARRVLGPAGANWLHDRVEGHVPTLTGHSVTWAKPTDGRVRIGIDSPEGATELEADHVIAATGYRVSLDRLTFLSEEVRSRLKTLAGSPVVGADYESSVPGLYFIGMAVAPTFGPVARFVCGVRHPASALAPRLATDGAGKRARPATVSQLWERAWTALASDACRWS